MEEDRLISWNSQIETLIAQESEKAQGLSWLHAQAELKYAKYETNLSMPVIILSTIVGFLSASQGSLFPADVMGSMLLGSISISVGILNTINSKFAFAKRAEGHRLTSIQYGKLHRFITIELSLPRKERMNANQMLKIIREDIDRLKEIAPAISEDVIALFNKKFDKYDTISKPEITNGLMKVTVYDESMSSEPIPTPVPHLKPKPDVKITLVN
jgi:hypothetical protein